MTKVMKAFLQQLNLAKGKVAPFCLCDEEKASSLNKSVGNLALLHLAQLEQRNKSQILSLISIEAMSS